jgi:hypothetical protein
LKKGESVHFRARLAAPPEGGRSVKVQFAALDPEPSGRPVPKTKGAGKPE